MRPVALTVALAVSLLTGCGDATGSEAIAANYTLQTINGQNLPFVLAQVVVDKVEVTAGSVRLNSDNTFSTSVTVATTESGATTSETTTVTGTYTLNGTTLTFTSEEDTFGGSITGNTLTISDEGVTFVYQK